jgi:hypothetical protein
MGEMNAQRIQWTKAIGEMNCGMIKYVGITLTNTNYIYFPIKARLNSQYTCYNSVPKDLSPITQNMVLFLVLYVCETCFFFLSLKKIWNESVSAKGAENILT